MWDFDEVSGEILEEELFAGYLFKIYRIMLEEINWIRVVNTQISDYILLLIDIVCLV
jgi:hypothetical protein